MSTLFVFPGQGAQKPGMLHALPQDRAVRATVDEASAALGRDLLGLDSGPALRSTVAAQLCLLVAGVATARSLEAEAGPPDAVAGFSIGAYAAAVTASVLSLPDAVRLVERRARLMESAFPAGYGMLAVTGLDQRAVEALIARAHAPAAPVYLANLNAPTQFVAAGAGPALARL
ncbi:MAG: acyltransferase domain-containing protein, partial [Burkholderiales bacterium]|nr:acyltransferase domain-containing protein [Burkholderiales bacterium]